MTDAIKALCKAQTEMGKALKKAANPHLKSKYADLGSVMEACLPALHDNGFAVIQPSGKDESGPYVETVLLHESGEKFASRIYLVLGKQDMQAVGSAQTYARRYGLLGMAGIAPEDDDGEATKRQPRQEPPKEDPPSVRDRIIAAMGRAENTESLRAVWNHIATARAIDGLPDDMQRAVKDAFVKKLESFDKGEAA
tara:strand:- start:124 stop:711 length:588 start_codon:yes stop_codon:yes gene_type:complete